MNEVLDRMLEEGLNNAIQDVAANDAVQDAACNAVKTVASTTLEDRLNDLAGTHECDFNLIKERVCGIDNRIDGLEATRVTTGDVIKIAGATALIAIPVGIGTAYVVKRWVAPKVKEFFAKKPVDEKVVADVDAKVVEENN